MATSIKNKILGISPYIELIIRRIYWNNIKLFNRLKKTKLFKNNKIEEGEPINFNKIINYLNTLGIGKGSLIIVHSSYWALLSTEKRPQEINNELLNLVGQEGTLAMPAIRKYKDAPSAENYLKDDLRNKTSIYNVDKTKIWTGVLPNTLLKHPDVVKSRFPLNSMIAVGKLAAKMMDNNLKGDTPTPNGINSSWKFCADNNAFIIGLGIDLVHNLTMIHTAEDVLNEKWPIKNWYRERTFKIIDKDFETVKIVKERNPKWGTLHFAEQTLRKDLLREDILKTTIIDGLQIEVLKSEELLSFLNSKNRTGYPYFWVKKHLK